MEGKYIHFHFVLFTNNTDMYIDTLDVTRRIRLRLNVSGRLSISAFIRGPDEYASLLGNRTKLNARLALRQRADFF